MTISNEMQAFLNGKLNVPYSHTSRQGSRYNTTISVTWGELAGALLPKLVAPIGGGYLGTLLETWVRERTNRSSIDIKSEFVDTIKITLSAFKLLTFYPASKVGGWRCRIYPNY